MHDIHDFLFTAQRDIQDEYIRILKREKQEPGTVGDQGEVKKIGFPVTSK